MQNVEIINRAKIKSNIRRSRIVNQLMLIIPALILFIAIVTAIFAPLLAPYDPEAINLKDRLLPPFFAEKGTTAHLMGTDLQGRDILSRVIYGTRVSLSVSLLVILITSVIGTVLGIISGYIGGRTDAIIMRITDSSIALPPLLIALLLAVSLGPGFFTVVLALSIFGWAPYARLIRGEVLRIRESDFISQARVIGASSYRIMLRYIFPNVVNIIIIGVTLSVGGLILAEAGLSYLGAGIPPPTPSWGAMVSDGRNLIDRAWWISFFPGIAIGLVVLAGNFLGDWIRDKMDPRLRQL